MSESSEYFDVPDALWEKAEPILERFRRKMSGGIPPIEFRRLLAGMLYQLKTGCQWSMIPKCYGAKSTLHEHFQRWTKAGAFAEIASVAALHFDKHQDFDFSWQSMDGTLVQAPVRKKKRRLKVLDRTQRTGGVREQKSICTWTNLACLWELR